MLERDVRKLVVIDTWDGLRTAGRGVCRLCNWSGVDWFDIGLTPSADDPEAYDYDEPAQADCPECGGHKTVQVDVDPDSFTRPQEPPPDSPGFTTPE